MISHRLKQETRNVNKLKSEAKQPFRAWHVLYIFVLILLISSLYGSINRLQRSRVDLNLATSLLTEEGNTLLKNQKTLEEMKKNIYVERVARDTLGLARAGEVTLQLPDDASVKKLSPRLFEPKARVLTDQTPIWKRWLQLLF